MRFTQSEYNNLLNKNFKNNNPIKVRKKNEHPERDIQIEVVNHLISKYPHIFFTIAPQGMKLPVWVAANFKRMGYSKGTPDLMIFAQRKTKAGLFIELKSENGVVKPWQKDWIDYLNKNGYQAEICYSAESAKKVIDDYFLVI